METDIPRLPDAPDNNIYGYIEFSPEFKAYVHACRGFNVHCIAAPGDTVRIVAKPGRRWSTNRRLFLCELGGGRGEPSGWHVVVQTGNYTFFLPGQGAPPGAFPLWRCRFSQHHACGSLGFSPLTCCTPCAQALAAEMWAA